MLRNFPVVVIVAIVLFSTGAVLSQTTASLTAEERLRRDQERRAERDLERRMNLMRDLDKTARTRDQVDQRAIVEPNLDKDARERVKNLRRIDQNVLNEYAKFLTLDNTGIIKLFPNQDCVSEQTVRINGDCKDFVPMSSSFSFRHRGYIVELYQDIEFVSGELRSRGFFSQGAFVLLGDIPIDEIDENDPAIVALAKVGNDDVYIHDARETTKTLKKGLEVNGMTLKSAVLPEIGKTYALRTIAYRFDGYVTPASPKSSMTEMKFLSLPFDRRTDQTVLFRIVRKGENDDLTIVWREVKHSDAPKLKMAKDEVLTDFRN